LHAKPRQEINVVPRPASIRPMSGSFSLGPDTRIIASDETRPLAEMLNEHIAKTYGFKLQIESRQTQSKNVIVFSADANAEAESYLLRADKKIIRIEGRETGLFYGLQTLIQLLPADSKVKPEIPAVEIRDQPRFRYRGMHLDVGRHFFPVEFIKRYLDLMARYKMNHFHWHLTEDQGWRVEIKKYPRLTSIGSRRKETVKDQLLDPFTGDGIPYGGYYTQEQIKEIVAYARSRWITIVPEIEMPGHSLAALAAYPELSCAGGPFEVGTTWGVYKDVYCPKEETFKFLEDVLEEVIALFPGQFVHIGGDECLKDRWKACAHCQELIKREGLKDEHELQSYFIRRIEKFLNSKGRRLIGWDEILEGGLAPNATVMSWRGQRGGIEAARLRHDVIMTPTDYCYFDYGQGDARREPVHNGGYLPLDKVYSFNPAPAELSAEEQRYILGAQGNVWTEYMKTPEKVEYMVFPRLLALAEVVWSPQESRDYGDFLRRLPSQLARLEREQVSFRIPEPHGLQDVLTTDDRPVEVRLESFVPGSKIYYTLDGSLPDERSKVYEKPFKVSLPLDQKITLNTRVVASGGRASAVYSALLLRRNYREAVDYTGNLRGLMFKLVEGRFASTKDMDGAATVSSGKTDSFELSRFDRRSDYGIIFEGYLKVAGDGVYRFAVESDDGSVLLIDGEEVVANDGLHARQTREGYIPLRKGFHRFTLKFFQRGGDAGLKIWWGRRGERMETIAGNVLFH
ncbi:MAG: family 20 glycosylhydrolase, partial [Acidobacteriota bacterium]